MLVHQRVHVQYTSLRFHAALSSEVPTWLCLKQKKHGWSIIFTSKEKHTYGASSFLEQPKLSHGWFKIERYPFISQSSYAMGNIELNPESRCSTRINIVFHKITTPPPKKKTLCLSICKGYRLVNKQLTVCSGKSSWLKRPLKYP